MSELSDLIPTEWSLATKDAMLSMFERARSEKLWFTIEGLSGTAWFAPGELEANWRMGMPPHQPHCWTLRNPEEHLHEIEIERAKLTTHFLEFKHRIAMSRSDLIRRTPSCPT